MSDPMTREKLRDLLSDMECGAGPDGGDIMNACDDLVAQARAEERAEVEQLREQLAAFVPPGALTAGETPALCGTCKDRLCVPGLPGCARCVKAEVERLRDERGRLAEQVTRARAKHRTPAERDDPDHPLCSCGLHSPCPTRRALDGTEPGQ